MSKKFLDLKIGNGDEHWTLEYRNVAGSNRSVKIYERKLMDALTVFNTQKETSGFDTPIRATYCYGVNGRSYVFSLQGRYDVPRQV